MKKWTKAYNDLKEIYLKEFLARWEKGEKTAIGINKYLSSLKLKPKKILDMPAGIGRISIPLAKYGYEVVGIDSSEYFVRYANRLSEKERCSSCRFLVSDMLSSFDIVQDFKPEVILNWWTSIGYGEKQDDVKLLTKLNRAVDKGTYLFIETWQRHYVFNNPIKRWWSPVEDILVLVESDIDPLGDKVISSHTYYERTTDGGLKLLSGFTSSIILYDANELRGLVEQCGWIVLDAFNSIETQIDFRPNEDRIVLVAQK